MHPGRYAASQYLFSMITTGSEGKCHRVLQQLQRQGSIDALVYTWAENHSVTLMQIIKDKGYLALSPPREKVLSALLNNRAGLLLQGEPDLIPPLVNLLSDPDGHFSRQAGYVLRNLSKTEMIDEFCRLEHSLRQPALRVILLECGYIASAPLPVKLYCLLVHQNPHLCKSISSDAVSLLLDYCDEEDEQVADYALHVALHLKNYGAREEVCRLFLHADRQRAGRIALQQITGLLSLINALHSCCWLNNGMSMIVLTATSV